MTNLIKHGWLVQLGSKFENKIDDNKLLQKKTQIIAFIQHLWNLVLLKKNNKM